MKRLVLICLALSASGIAAAQSADSPLDLRVPEQSAIAAADTVPTGDPPGTYYGDTSGKPSRRGTEVAEDDGTAKVWGSFTTGIGHTKGYGTSHYNAAEINVAKSFGERDNTVNLQIRVEQGDGPGFGGPYPYPSPYFDRDPEFRQSR